MRIEDWKKFLLPQNWHSAADVYALLPDDSSSFQALSEDIREQGLNNPIALYEGKILDGRNRVRACALANVEPEFFEWKPKLNQTPESWSKSQNSERRHLTPSQIMVAKDELRYSTQVSDMKKEYPGLEKEYGELRKKVKNGEMSLVALVRRMDALRNTQDEEERPYTLGAAMQIFLRFLSYEFALPVYRSRQEQLPQEKKSAFSNAWGVIREGIYGFTSDLSK